MSIDIESFELAVPTSLTKMGHSPPFLPGYWSPVQCTWPFFLRLLCFVDAPSSLQWENVYVKACTHPPAPYFSSFLLSRLQKVEEHLCEIIRSHDLATINVIRHLATACFANWNHSEKRQLHGKKSWHKLQILWDVECEQRSKVEKKRRKELRYKEEHAVDLHQQQRCRFERAREGKHGASKETTLDISSSWRWGHHISGIKHLRSWNLLLSGPVTAAKARDFASQMGIENTVSKGWLTCFKACHELTF